MSPPKLPSTRRHHWYAVLLFVMGTLFPPLAVAARFGIGKDFWLNLLLTIAGYIPGHVHNFYIQNVRNNKNYQRTPKWAVRYGLVDSSTIRRHERRSQWANKYNDRIPDSGYDQQPLEDGQVAPPTRDSPDRSRDGLWRPDDESYYSAEQEDGGRWRYLPKSNDSLPDAAEATTKKQKKKDRWARTEDAYSVSGQKKKKKKKKSKARDVDSTYSQRTESTGEPELPEEATGNVYAGHQERNPLAKEGNGDVVASDFNHEF